MPAKSLPQPTPETAMFWTKAKQHELWLQKCEETGKFFFPPRPASPFTGGPAVWERVSGRARLVSFNIPHRAAPGFEGEAPYIVAIAALDEGPNMLTNLPGAAPDPTTLKIGARLELTFEDRGDFSIPQFRLADSQ